MSENTKNDKSAHYDWAQNAENAAKKAEAEINKIKKEAQEEFNKNKPNLK
ncbi:hypothetical protein [Sporosarcina pasteurii]|uniref:Small, acid-soluble spore protein tlp n=1 Tax=Sporosarcina pasteurii TaxID=1474 RepID=A0A380CB16_SPOPA|nr:hypothetical protein [Sporosarcina pasteurii]MDS9473089.1 hypothetical protein [Sporosarcina pasteurii]SUJ17026.1 Uncharacterised protein [Sporosarcina pasteurii]